MSLNFLSLLPLSFSFSPLVVCSLHLWVWFFFFIFTSLLYLLDSSYKRCHIVLWLTAPSIMPSMFIDIVMAKFHSILCLNSMEWVAISFSKGSSQPRDRARISCITGRLFTDWATRKLYTHTCVYIHDTSALSIHLLMDI